MEIKKEAIILEKKNKVFDLVNNVNLYKNFVPYCVDSKILSEQMRLNLMPQIISPIGGLLTNQRFTGSPIVPSFMKDYLPLESQDYPWSNAAILSAFRKNPQWSNWAGLSPVAVEHLMKSYTGTLGAYVMDFIIDPAFREGGIDLGGLPPRPDITGYGFGTWDNAPLVKRMFVGETPRHTEAIIKSYQLKNEVTKRMNQLKKMEKKFQHFLALPLNGLKKIHIFWYERQTRQDGPTSTTR